MKNYLYVFYNKLSARYEAVQCFPADEYAIHQCAKMKVPTDEYELCRIGSIDVETGIVETSAPVRLVLKDVPLPTSEAN